MGERRDVWKRYWRKYEPSRINERDVSLIAESSTRKKVTVIDTKQEETIRTI